MNYKPLIEATANKYGVPPELALAVANQESNFNPSALSHKGAIGLFQLMPGTARDLGVDPNIPEQNIDGGIRYLKQQYDTFGDWSLALAAYNAGPGNVRKYGGTVPPFQETRNYVSRILGSMGFDYHSQSARLRSGEHRDPFITAVVKGKLRIVWATIPTRGNTAV